MPDEILAQTSNQYCQEDEELEADLGQTCQKDKNFTFQTLVEVP